MGRMRTLLAIALIVFGITAGSAARGADVATGHTGSYSSRYSEQGQRSAMLWLYDDQPGVVVRAYWRAPWPLFPGHRRPAPGWSLRKSVRRQSAAEAGEDVSPYLVERLGLRARTVC